MHTPVHVRCCCTRAQPGRRLEQACRRWWQRGPGETLRDLRLVDLAANSREGELQGGLEGRKAEAQGPELEASVPMQLVPEVPFRAPVRPKHACGGSWTDSWGGNIRRANFRVRVSSSQGSQSRQSRHRDKSCGSLKPKVRRGVRVIRSVPRSAALLKGLPPRFMGSQER